MTMNEAIALINTVLALSLIALGVLFLWQAWQRRSVWTWPPSALVALGIVPLLTGLIIGQLVVFRLGAMPSPFGPNEWGTLALRLITTAIVLGKLTRVWRGQLLTARDRTRIVREDGYP